MIILNGSELERKEFPNGEMFIDIDESMLRNNEVNIITLKYQDDRDLTALMYVTDYIKDMGNEVELKLSYIPYSRMDRKENNRLFTLKSVARFINTLGFNKVYVSEPHSDVSTALLDRVEISNTTFELTRMLIHWKLKLALYIDTEKLKERADQEGIYLVYPDAGASKRYGKQFNYKNVIECSKERDFDTGRITKLDIANEVDISKVKTAIIVDDLCSKGGTFKLVGKMLRDKGVEEIYLVVAHCENTIFEGDLLSTDIIDKIITTDSILDKGHEKIEVYKTL